MDRNPQVIVAYSHNVSQAIRVHKLPRPGETIRALQASAGMDGAKGTNTAVACSRCWGPTTSRPSRTRRSTRR